MAEAKKNTTRTRRSTKPQINDAEGLKDSQELNQVASENLGGTASPGSAAYQTRQFDVGPTPDLLGALANPPQAAVDAAKASDEHYKNYGKKKEEGAGDPETPETPDPETSD